MDNIAILAKGEFLDLNDSSIRIERSNSFFITELFQGDYSFPFELPATEKNLRITGFVNYLDSGNRQLTIPVDLYVFGLPTARFNMVITRGKKRSISAVLVGGIKALKSADMKLSEIPLGDDVFLGNDIPEITTFATLASKQGDWRVNGFTFVPFYMPEFYDDKNPDFNGVVNQTDSTSGDILCINGPVTGNVHCLVPWLFAFHVLNQIFLYEGLNPEGSFWNDPECQKLLLTNNYSLDGGLADGSVHVVTVPNPGNPTNVALGRVQFKLGPPGTYDTSGGWANSGIPSGSFYAITQTGVHYIDVVLNVVNPVAIAGEPSYYEFFTIRVDSTEVARVDIETSIVGSQQAYMSYSFTAGVADIGKIIDVESFSTLLNVEAGSTLVINLEKSINTLNNTLSFKNHVADQTVGEFLAEIKKLGVNFDFDFQSNRVVMDSTDYLLNYSAHQKWQEKASPEYDLSLEDAGKGVTIEYAFPEEEKQKTDLKLDSAKFKGEFPPRTYFPEPAIVGQWIIISGTNEILTVGKNLAGQNEWQTLGYNYSPVVIGAGESKLTSNLAPVQMVTALNANGTYDENFALMPRLFGQGYSELFGNGTSPQPFRLAFWRGQNRTVSFLPQGGNYILATSGIYGVNGDTYGSMTLRLDKDSGMILRYTKKLYNAINAGEVVEKDINLSALDVYGLKNFTLVDIDYNVFLIKSISISISKSRIDSKGYLLKI